jgi:alkylresorcinol/alkylpyrone synthase
VAQYSSRAFDRNASEIDRLLPVFANAGIETRFLCMPLGWYVEPRGWVERNCLYVQHAVDLLAATAAQCLGKAGREIGEVDGIVTVSTTGIATPSLDALLIERLAMRRDVRRLPVFGLGCAGGVIGLTRAVEMARAVPDALVLLLVVELCSLTFRYGDMSNSNIVAAALFGDGAAGALLGCDGNGPTLGPGGEHTWPQSLDVMGWRIEENGFGVLFSRDIPAIVRRDLRPAVEAFLARNGLRFADFAGHICHPGGAKVMDALEEAYELSNGSLTEAREVLRQFGNMSAVTVLFVLERIMRRPVAGRYLMSALGPGFTAGFQIIEFP